MEYEEHLRNTLEKVRGGREEEEEEAEKEEEEEEEKEEEQYWEECGAPGDGRGVVQPAHLRGAAHPVHGEPG